MLGACLATQRRPATEQLQPADMIGGIANMMPASHVRRFAARMKPEIAVHCFPLNSIMAALNVTHVDYLSLDVEGPEVEILRTVDWSRLRVDVITVEYVIAGGGKSRVDVPATLTKLAKLRQFFRQTGIHREVTVLPAGSDERGQDVVFALI